MEKRSHDPEMFNSSMLSTPQKAVKAARIELMQRIAEAIQGSPIAHPMDENDFDPSFFNTSPQSFIKKMRNVIQEQFSFAEKGITPEMIEKTTVEVQEALKADSFEKEYFETPSSPLRAEVSQKIDQEQAPVTILKANHIDDVAYAKADLIVVNEEKLYALAPTPKRREVILRHEWEHVKSKDLARKKALEKLVKEQAIACAASRQEALARPNDFSPDTKSKMLQHARIGEVFADVGAINSCELAEAAVRLWSQETPQDGQEEPSDEHPPRAARLALARASKKVHNAHTYLEKRKRFEELAVDRPTKKAVARKLIADYPEKDSKENK